MSDWMAVNELIRELGSVRNAADQMSASENAKTAVDAALHEAALALSLTVDSPRNRDKLTTARDAIGVAAEVIIALDAEIGRSLVARERPAILKERALEFIRRANRES
jgi:hypothetical protein